MKINGVSLAVLSIGMTVGVAQAKWGNGLGHEYKTLLIPENQQSGWGTKTTGDAKPMAQKSAQPIAVEKQQTKAITDKDWLLSGIQFEKGSDKIKSSSKDSLDEAADILNSHQRAVVEIQGHTDSTGDAAVNKSLSEKRAAAVKNYLIGKGVDAGRMEARGYGQEQPIADNGSEEGRAQNRRIQFKVLKK